MVAQALLMEIGPLIMGASFLFFVGDLPRCIVGLPWIAAVSWRASLKLALFMRRAAVSLHVVPLACSNTNITSCSKHLLSVTLTSSKGFADVSATFVVCFAEFIGQLTTTSARFACEWCIANPSSVLPGKVSPLGCCPGARGSAQCHRHTFVNISLKALTSRCSF